MSADARAHFRIAGTPVRVEPVFWVIVVLFGFGVRDGWSLALWVGIVFVSILLHELGHAMAYKAFGQPSAIVLHGFAGLTFGRRLPRFKSIVVSLAGPLSALLLLGLPALALREGRFGEDLFFDVVTGQTWVGWYIALDDVVFVNVWWSIINLLPIRPLDGGNVLSELAGVRIARFVSMGVAAVAAVYAFSTDYRFAAFFAALLGFMNYSEWKQAERGGGGGSPFGLDLEPPGTTRPPRRPRKGRIDLRSVPAGPGAHGATLPSRPPADSARQRSDLELRGWNALRNGQSTEVRRVVAAGGTDLSPHLRASAALHRGDTDTGVPLMAEALASGPAPNLVPASMVAATGTALAVTQQLLARAGGTTGAADLQTHLHYGGHHREAAVVGEALHAAGSRAPAQTAFEVACAWAQAGDTDRAFTWLATAARQGFRAPALVTGEPDLEPLRGDSRWPEAAAALGA